MGLLSLGSSSGAVVSLREMLDFLQWTTTAGQSPEDAGFFDAALVEAVEAFQASEGLLVDGIVGPVTFGALQDAYAERIMELHPTDGLEDGARLPFVRTEADPYGTGYDRFTLRIDVAQAFERVRSVATSYGVILPSSGGRRALTARKTPSRSATSFHYVGRALDLYLWSAMMNPSTDPLVVQREEERKYRVYGRVNKDGAEGRRVEGLDNVIRYAPVEARRIGERVEGSFLDLTELFEEHGFKPIRARRNFEWGGSRLGAEWWHFQYERGLVPGLSTFGDELLRVYPRSALVDTPPWAYRDRVFGVDWH